MIKFLRGSRNYLLHEKNSDYDYTLVYLPTFEELYCSSDVNSSWSESGQDSLKMSARNYAKSLRKMNPSVLETLFSLETESSEDMWEFQGFLIGNRYRIFAAGPKRFYYATKGTMVEKARNLQKGTGVREEDVSKYGYSLKDFQHFMRLSLLMTRVLDNLTSGRKDNPFLQDSETHYNFLKEIRQGIYSLEEVLKIVETVNQYVASLEEEFKRLPIDTTVFDELDAVVKEIIKLGLGAELCQ